jgi:hypothetical protein
MSSVPSITARKDTEKVESPTISSKIDASSQSCRMIFFTSLMRPLFRRKGKEIR